MKKAPRILVTLDGSTRDATAVAEAKQLAGGIRPEVVLMRVIKPPRMFSSPAADLLPPVDIAERQADAALRRHETAFPGLRVTRVVLVGNSPAKEITDWLRWNPVDYVVMATRGHGRLFRLFVDSVAGAVQRRSAAPVIIVREPAEPAKPAPAAAPRPLIDWSAGALAAQPQV